MSAQGGVGSSESGGQAASFGSFASAASVDDCPVSLVVASGLAPVPLAASAPPGTLSTLPQAPAEVSEAPARTTAEKSGDLRRLRIVR
jgi:hypothetical protein